MNFSQMTRVAAASQMAVFSAVGLGAAFLTVVCWFPWLDRAEPRPSTLSRAMEGWMSRWPQARPNARWWIAAAVMAAMSWISAVR